MSSLASELRSLTLSVWTLDKTLADANADGERRVR